MHVLVNDRNPEDISWFSLFSFHINLGQYTRANTW